MSSSITHHSILLMLLIQPTVNCSRIWRNKRTTLTRKRKICFWEMECALKKPELMTNPMSRDIDYQVEILSMKCRLIVFKNSMESLMLSLLISILWFTCFRNIVDFKLKVLWIWRLNKAPKSCRLRSEVVLSVVLQTMSQSGMCTYTFFLLFLMKTCLLLLLVFKLKNKLIIASLTCS